MDNYDDDTEDYDPAIAKFGRDEFVLAHADPGRVRKLLDEQHRVTQNAILASCYTASDRTLEILLTVQPDPNVRLEGADGEHTDVRPDWAASDVSPQFGRDKREWYPLQCANIGPLDGYYGGKEASTRVTNAILRHHPDLFAVYKQPLLHRYPFPRSEPQEAEPDHEEEGSDDDDDDGSDPDDYSDSRSMVDGAWRKKPNADAGYGLRSVLHSIFEDGGNLTPFLDPDFEVDLQARDPLGRTLLHSACRNAVGADARIDAIVDDVPSHLPPKSQALIARDDEESSIFHTLRKRGADLTAVDDSGRNILHHLFEARTPPWTSYGGARPPLIHNTLKYVLHALPQLVNQPDHHGTYPVHTALQRLRGHVEYRTFWEDAPLEQMVIELLNAGADATKTDSRGNTALHYLADNGLAEQVLRTEARELCRRVCDAGADVNARNNQDLTALEILMDDDGTLGRQLASRNVLNEEPRRPYEEIDAEVFGMFDEAGARWAEQNAEGRTLLHFAARHQTPKTAYRTNYLLRKGVDPGITDKEGKTAQDIAKESGNEAAIEALKIHS